MSIHADEVSARGPMLARVIVALVIVAQLTLQFANLYDARDVAWKYVLAGACGVGLWTLQVFYFSRPGVDLRSRLSYGLLLVQAILAFGPIVPLNSGYTWAGEPCLLAGTLLLVLRGWIRWAAYAVTILAATSWVVLVVTDDPLNVVIVVVTNSIIALEIYGVTRLASLITELHAARSALAAAAVAHERLGFARDVNGRLGIALASIESRAQLALRYLQSNTARAQAVLTEIQAVARTTLADLRAVAHSYRSSIVAHTSGAALLPAAVREAQWILRFVLFGTVWIGILRVDSYTDDPFDLGLSVVSFALMLAIHIAHFATPTVDLQSRRSHVLFAVQALLLYMPTLLFGWSWLTSASLLACTALLVLPAVVGAPVFGLVVVSVGLFQAITSGNLVRIMFDASGTLTGGLMVFGLTWMVRAMTELRATQLQLDRAAVADERLRLARDLHDLLGMSLSAIALKSDLADRLAAATPDRTQVEVSELLTITRRALVDVREVVDTHRELSLGAELREAHELLRAAGVRVELDVGHAALLPTAETLLATVLREGVTNVLRHSDARQVRVTLVRKSDQVELRLVNDGVTGLAPRLAGSGLDNLAHRLASVGGSLGSGREPGGRFRLVARLPV